MAKGRYTKAPQKPSLGDKVFDATLGGGELDFRTTTSSRILLVTDRNVYLFEGRRISDPGPLRSKFTTGSDDFVQSGSRCSSPTAPRWASSRPPRRGGSWTPRPAPPNSESVTTPGASYVGTPMTITLSPSSSLTRVAFDGLTTGRPLSNPAQ